MPVSLSGFRLSPQGVRCAQGYGESDSEQGTDEDAIESEEDDAMGEVSTPFLRIFYVLASVLSTGTQQQGPCLFVVAAQRCLWWQTITCKKYQINIVKCGRSPCQK